MITSPTETFWACFILNSRACLAAESLAFIDSVGRELSLKRSSFAGDQDGD